MADSKYLQNGDKLWKLVSVDYASDCCVSNVKFAFYFLWDASVSARTWNMH